MEKVQFKIEITDQQALIEYLASRPWGEILHFVEAKKPEQGD